MRAALAGWALATIAPAAAQTAPPHDWMLVDVGIGAKGAGALYIVDRGSIRDAGAGEVQAEMALVGLDFAARSTVAFDCTGKRWRALHSTYTLGAIVQEHGEEPWTDVAGPSAPSRMLDFACARGAAAGRQSLGPGDPVASGRTLLARKRVVRP